MTERAPRKRRDCVIIDFPTAPRSTETGAPRVESRPAGAPPPRASAGGACSIQGATNRRTQLNPSTEGGDAHAAQNAGGAREPLAPGGTGKGACESKAAQEAVTPLGVRRTPKPQAPSGEVSSPKRLTALWQRVRLSWEDRSCPCCAKVMEGQSIAWQSLTGAKHVFCSPDCLIRTEKGTS